MRFPFGDIALGVARLHEAVVIALVPALLAAELLVTISSDDPAYFGGYVDDNLTAIEAEFALDPHQMATLARNSFRASFLPEAEKRRQIAAVDEHLEGLLRLISGA